MTSTSSRVRRVLVTGGYGFIGSHLVRGLVNLGCEVRVLDDLATGRRSNLAAEEGGFEFVAGSVLDAAVVDEAMKDVDACLHQAAIPSVPRSVADPLTTTRVNVEGTMNILEAARKHGVRRVVMASSSSVYGDATEFPLHERLPLRPLSPYAASKASGEMYANAYSKLHGVDVVCLRYFNVFGPWQNPRAQYAAVVPAFIQRLRQGEAPVIYGTGEQVRDFTYIENVVQANLAAMLHEGDIAGAYNIAGGEPVSLLQLVEVIGTLTGSKVSPTFEPGRAGDLPKSFASITRAKEAFGYMPSIHWREGLERTVAWFSEGSED